MLPGTAALRNLNLPIPKYYIPLNPSPPIAHFFSLKSFANVFSCSKFLPQKYPKGQTTWSIQWWICSVFSVFMKTLIFDERNFWSSFFIIHVLHTSYVIRLFLRSTPSPLIKRRTVKSPLDISLSFWLSICLKISNQC